MAVDTLMRYLEDGNKQVNIQFEQGFINRATISCHEFQDNNLLYIHTTEGHQVKIDVSEFKRICFDSVVYDATNEEEMERCLDYLGCFKYFNAYLQDQSGNYILDFLFISDK